MIRLALAVMCAALLAGPALAGGCTVTTSPAVCVPGHVPAYRSVVISNEGTQNICVTDDGSTPSCGAAGTYTIPPAGSRVWSSANVQFGAPFTAVSSTGTQPATYTAQ